MIGTRRFFVIASIDTLPLAGATRSGVQAFAEQTGARPEKFPSAPQVREADPPVREYPASHP